jgi:hypothetical protein
MTSVAAPEQVSLTAGSGGPSYSNLTRTSWELGSSSIDAWRSSGAPGVPLRATRAEEPGGAENDQEWRPRAARCLSQAAYPKHVRWSEELGVSLL